MIDWSYYPAGVCDSRDPRSPFADYDEYAEEEEKKPRFDEFSLIDCKGVFDGIGRKIKRARHGNL